jgi:hypothetical protein
LNPRRTEPQVPLVERAYQLARTGAFLSIGEIKARLKREGFTNGYIEAHLAGKTIREDLARVLREATKD